MADYITLSELKDWGDFDGTNDDEMLGTVISGAIKAIDNYCGRTFTYDEATVRSFSRYGIVRDNVDGRLLLFDEDLASEALVISDSPTVIYLPENNTPYYGMYLVEGSWTYPTVTVSGYWAYSETPPDDIKVGCLKLADWMFEQKNTNEGVGVMITPEGQVLLPSGLPDFIVTILNPYRKARVA
ncbi:hypothetical protein LCGC14_1460000 [marine sediment metagenome]|uniref:Phage gp6-like head-tail connector protein n=1 Tax=marine sediment metagenome TaxID=412755 RepID=A0A0F9JFC0_9ZZZZ